MKYQVDIQGMHCQGCVGLITMSLEDVGFEEVIVNLAEAQSSFSSTKAKDDVVKLLQEAFKDIEKYTYSNVQTVN